MVINVTQQSPVSKGLCSGSDISFTLGLIDLLYISDERQTKQLAYRVYFVDAEREATKFVPIYDNYVENLYSQLLWIIFHEIKPFPTKG